MYCFQHKNLFKFLKNMNRPKMNEKFRRNKVVNILFTAEELQKLDQLYKLHDCRDRSDYIRKAALGKIKIDLEKLNKE
jgi:predicted nucleic acid-binding protein